MMGGEATAISPYGSSPANPFGQTPFGASPFDSSPFASNPFDQADVAVVNTAAKAEERVGQDDGFAREAFKAWVAHLRDLPTRKTLLAQLGIETELIDLLTEELVTAANRLDLEGTLKRTLAGQEQAGGAARTTACTASDEGSAYIARFRGLVWFFGHATREGTTQLCGH
ncbi:virulence factor SrfC family protein [Aeromonas veronii]|uniref:virulence factor SrfC family protein n=1 Tax=Aeromonas veronii TaxID=654 RepID=UPI002442F046|nr:virulence factor SrfC family protein [Aeromonas veronii]